MSTKIHNGHRAENLEHLLDYLGQKNDLVEQAIDRMLRKQLLQWFHDPANIEKFETEEKKYWVLWRTFFDSVLKDFRAHYAEMERSGSDFRLGLAIRLHEGRVYFWPMTGDGIDFDWEAVLKDAPGTIPYPYFNNTDRPEEFTREEWDARGEEWDEALKRPVFSFHFVDWSNLHQLLPLPRDERFERLIEWAPEAIRKARLLRQADDVLRNDFGQGQEYCREKILALYREAGEPWYPIAFEWAWNHLEEMRAKKAAGETQQSS